MPICVKGGCGQCCERSILGHFLRSMAVGWEKDRNRARRGRFSVAVSGSVYSESLESFDFEGYTSTLCSWEVK